MQSIQHILPGCKYVNLKTGNVYQVFQLGSHSETEEGLIVYVLVKKDSSFRHRLGLLCLRFASLLLTERVWLRPIESFATKFKEPN